MIFSPTNGPYSIGLISQKPETEPLGSHGLDPARLSLYNPVVRFVVVLLTLLAACPSSSTQDDGANTDPDFGMGDAGAGSVPFIPCERDADCALAGTTCCACPSFVVRADDPSVKACNSIACPANDCPSNLRAACENNACQVACAPVACSNACPAGYAADASGCLTCACIVADADTCVANTDCVEVKADCCGCARGGTDVAILATRAAAYNAALNCSSDPACPNQDVCPPDTAPMCEAGRCALDTPVALPPGACGRSDLMACPAGQTCTVNANHDADRLGVGVCTPL
jgi:hypothetical protein